jgi:hypothetical protein
MTNQNKLIVGAVVVLGAYYLYNKYKVKSEVQDLKDGADYPAPPPAIAPAPVTASTTVPTTSTQVNTNAPTLVEGGGGKFSNFAGKKGNSYFETIF